MLKRNKTDEPTQLFIEQFEDRQMLSSVNIFAAGATGHEAIQLKIDDAVVKTWSNVGGNIDAGHYQTLSYQANETISAGQIKIEFVNDLYDIENGIDRNVRVDRISIDGTVYQTEDPSVFSTGTWRPEDGIVAGNRQSEYLHTNGYFQFAGGSHNGTTIDVTFRGTTGDEQFNVEANGQILAEWTAGTSFQTYSVLDHRSHCCKRPSDRN